MYFYHLCSTKVTLFIGSTKSQPTTFYNLFKLTFFIKMHFYVYFDRYFRYIICTHAEH